MVPKKIKERNTSEKSKNKPKILMKSYEFMKDIIFGGAAFLQIPGEGLLAKEENST